MDLRQKKRPAPSPARGSKKRANTNVPPADSMNPVWIMFVSCPFFSFEAFKQLSLVNKSFVPIMDPVMSKYTYKVPTGERMVAIAPRSVVIERTFKQATDTSKLQRLTFNSNYYKSVLVFPPSITELSFGGGFAQSIAPYILPPALTRLSISGYGYNLPLPELPKSITYIKFKGEYFNQLLDNLPTSVTHLKVKSKNFNQPLDHLPNSVTRLTLGLAFNQPIDNLPQSLQKLKFSAEWGTFNAPIANLPRNLTHLILSRCFNYPIDNLPPTLTHLTFGHCFNHPVDRLPPTLTHLSFVTDRYSGEGNQMRHNIDNLPQSLIYLSLKTSWNLPLNKLPPLVYLELDDSFSADLSKLPPSIVHMKLGRPHGFVYHPLPDLPNLQHLTIDGRMDKCPPSVTHLRIKSRGRSVEFPPKLTHLVGYRLIQFPPFPASLKYVSTSSRLDQEVRDLRPDIQWSSSVKWDCDLCCPKKKEHEYVY